MLVGRRVASETEGHVHGRDWINHGHEIDTAMAFDTADAPRGVNAVMKEDVLRQIRDAVPQNGFARCHARSDVPEEVAAIPYLVMAAHTERRARNAGIGAARCSAMAVETIDPVVARVVTMVEQDRLLHRIVLLSHIRRSLPHHEERRDAEREQSAGQKGGSKKRIGVAREELGHLRWPRSSCVEGATERVVALRHDRGGDELNETTGVKRADAVPQPACRLQRGVGRALCRVLVARLW